MHLFTTEFLWTMVENAYHFYLFQWDLIAQNRNDVLKRVKNGEGWEKDYKGGCRWKVELDTCLSKAHLRQAVNSAEYKNDQFIVSVARVELFLNVKKNAAFEEGDSGKASRQLETDYQQLCNGKRALPVTFVQSEQFSFNFCSLMISKLAFDS
ncbi:hypothetical protein T06_6440 [Trichinella sp. T6]|nr:hypothetical protein T06_6440 [Trichinella sp. T6]